MPRKRRLGVIGTLVWDVIYGCPPESERVEGWGGIAYALSALAAALPQSWEIVPIIKVGADVEPRADEFLATLHAIAPETALVVVPEPNNRSELRYYSDERTEFLSGGTPGWTWTELESRLRDQSLDALYVNFLSGWELDLATAERMRVQFRGPMYVDLHMLLWVADASGLRALQALPDAKAWYGCFDFVQVNEQEMAILARDPAALARDTFERGVLCTVVTLGARGAQYFAVPDLSLARLSEARTRHITAEAAHAELVASPTVRGGPRIDPTGCGDVWGATYFARLLAGDTPASAVATANDTAGQNAEYHGVSGLVEHLSSVVPRVASRAGGAVSR